MAQKKLQLGDLFQAVTETLAENQSFLDQADDYNHNHGTNMVQTFETITRALQEKKKSTDSAALRYAARQLSSQTSSGSGKLYAENLARAASQFKGKKVDSRGALDLLQTLIGSGQATGTSAQGGDDLLGTILGMAGGGQASGGMPAPSSGGDLLGDLLGSLAGGGTQVAQQPSQASQDPMSALLGSLLGGGQSSGSQPNQSGGGDMFGSLLGSLLGGGSSSSGEQDKPGAGNLLNAAMAFFQAKQSGGNTMQALIQAFMAANRMGDAAHRSQSTQVVVESFLQALQESTARKR